MYYIHQTLLSSLEGGKTSSTQDQLSSAISPSYQLKLKKKKKKKTTILTQRVDI